MIRKSYKQIDSALYIIDVNHDRRIIDAMNEAQKKFQQKAAAEGRVKLGGFLPPESSQVVRAMVTQGYAASPIQACHVALLRMVQEDSGK